VKDYPGGVLSPIISLLIEAGFYMFFDDPKIKITVSEVKTDSDGRKFIALTIDAEQHFNSKGLL